VEACESQQEGVLPSAAALLVSYRVTGVVEAAEDHWSSSLAEASVARYHEVALAEDLEVDLTRLDGVATSYVAEASEVVACYLLVVACWRPSLVIQVVLAVLVVVACTVTDWVVVAFACRAIVAMVVEVATAAVVVDCTAAGRYNLTGVVVVAAGVAGAAGAAGAAVVAVVELDTGCIENSAVVAEAAGVIVVCCTAVVVLAAVKVLVTTARTAIEQQAAEIATLEVVAAVHIVTAVGCTVIEALADSAGIVVGCTVVVEQEAAMTGPVGLVAMLAGEFLLIVVVAVLRFVQRGGSACSTPAMHCTLPKPQYARLQPPLQHWQQLHQRSKLLGLVVGTS
jgi:hypothetical protein